MSDLTYTYIHTPNTYKWHTKICDVIKPYLCLCFFKHKTPSKGIHGSFHGVIYMQCVCVSVSMFQCAKAFLAAVTVFFITMAMVTGPTPPGTGVIKPAFCRTPADEDKKINKSCMPSLTPYPAFSVNLHHTFHPTPLCALLFPLEYF